MITPLTFNYPVLHLYNDKGEMEAVIRNDIELLDARLQICEQDLEGYYLVNRDTKEKTHIDRFGVLDTGADFPYHLDLKYLREIISSQSRKRIKEHNLRKEK